MGVFDARYLLQARRTAEDGDEHRGNRHIDQRAGDGDHEFLAGFFRHALESGDAADRQQRDVRRLDPETPRRGDVTELVEHDADEDGDDESNALHRSRVPPIR